MSTAGASTPLRAVFDKWNAGETSLVRGLFSRALGVIYLIAFASFGTQILGLIGSHGLLPLADFLNNIRAGLGASAVLYAPTLFWLNSGDLALQVLPWLGVFLALRFILGISHPLLYLGLYVLYLSFVVAGQDFMAFQWDNLLLEVGFLAIFLKTPGSLIVWLYRLLLFKLMFMSGAVKLVSGDPNWRNLTALDYHYWTQPLPTVFAWYAAQLPEWFQRLSVVVTLLIEGLVPFLIFTTRRLRALAGGLLILLQGLILLTGNYTFFNWLAIALCLFCFDDPMLRRMVGARLTNLFGHPFTALSAWRPMVYLARAVAVVVVIVSVSDILYLFSPIPDVVVTLSAVLEPFRTVNSYGLFAVMTTDRPELVIEGSNDGVTWLPYEFPYKAGDVKRMPSFVAPLQPRLDWQLWFEGLEAESSQGPDSWFNNLLLGLLRGTPEVLALVQTDPFPNRPPQYVRAWIAQYRFTDAATHARTGAWWTSTPQGAFVPALYLQPPVTPDINLSIVPKR